VTCTITPNIEKQYIYMKIIGNINRKLATKYNIEAHSMGKQLQINRYLVDLTGTVSNEPIIDQYDFAYKDMKDVPEIDKSACIAILVSPEDHSHDFIEIVSRNNGANVILFRDREQAENYLVQFE
jgi:hypothetical protein